MGVENRNRRTYLTVFSPMKNKTKRWANPAEFEYYARAYSLHTLARILRRTPRTIRDWQLGNRPIPSWAPEVLRLRIVEAEHYRRQLDYMRLDKRRQKIAPTDLRSATSCGRTS